MRVHLNGADLTIDVNAMDSRGRECGSCQLCCKLLPVPPLAKKAGQRCQHSRHGKGCQIYPSRPAECRDWSCRWLAEATETAGMRRPDHAHYVIDQFPDRIRLVNKLTGEETIAAVMQVWIDPAFPEAKHDPALRAYIARMAEPPTRMATILRYSSARATVIAPPSMSSTEEWYEDDAPVLVGEGGMWSRSWP